MRAAWLLFVGLAALPIPPARAAEESGPVGTLTLAPSPGNPRNSEGDFIALKDGRILFVYTHFTGGGDDNDSAHLAGRFSSDGGRTWTERDEGILPNEAGCNIMSVSLRRLDDGRIALFYLRKNSPADCRPCLRFSKDEAKTWGPPIVCIPDSDTGYFVMNNDRVVRLSGGRWLLPLALHHRPDWPKTDFAGTLLCYCSDDDGATWRRSADLFRGFDAKGARITVQEPGVVELKDGRAMMFCRTGAGCQYAAYSEDRGDHWSALKPTAIASPLSPASIERIPSTGDLLLVWNNHEGIDPALKGRRTPLTVAISRDDGKTWERARNLAADPAGWYCYTAVFFAGDHVLLGHCAGDTRNKGNGLATTQITRFPVRWLYGRSSAPEGADK